MNRSIIKIRSIIRGWPIISSLFFSLPVNWIFAPDAFTKYIQTTRLFILDNKKTVRINKWGKCPLALHGHPLRKFLLACRRFLYVQSQLSPPGKHKNLVNSLFLIIFYHKITFLLSFNKLGILFLNLIRPNLTIM